LSNKDFQNPAHFTRAVWATQIPAFKDRSTLIELPFDEAAMLEYTLWLAPTILSQVKTRGERGYDRFLSKAQKADLIEHLVEHQDRYREISPRMVTKFGKLRLAHDDEWWPKIRDSQLLPAQPTSGTQGLRPALPVKGKPTLVVAA
jgi:hypothetical protein